MNQRIRELIEQATESKGFLTAGDSVPPLPVKEFNKEKFAELIVQECIDCLKPLSRNHSMVGAAQDTIKEHFGVEE